MLIGEIVGVVVVAAVVAALLLRRRSHDDVHSVEHYHRQLHTLEEMRTHPGSDHQQESTNGEASNYPARAFRVSGSSTVRLTEPGHTLVPPVPPPPVPNPSEPVTFDDEADTPEPTPSSFMTGSRDKAMDGINHRPRRIGGPLLAVVAVLAVIAVLIVTGLHSNSPSHKRTSDSATTTPTTHPPVNHHATTTTTTTAPPAVSAPQSATAHTATYALASSNYSLVLAATTGECWVEATDPTTGAVLFTATLFAGQSHTIAATGPVTVIAGAPGEFAANVDGTAVTLPPGNQAPFTLHFVTAGTAGTSGTAGTAGTSTTSTT